MTSVEVGDLRVRDRSRSSARNSGDFTPTSASATGSRPRNISSSDADVIEKLKHRSKSKRWSSTSMDRWEHRFAGILHLVTGFQPNVSKVVCDYVLDSTDPPPDQHTVLFDIDRISPLLTNRRLSTEARGGPRDSSVSPQTRTPPRIDWKARASMEQGSGSGSPGGEFSLSAAAAGGTSPGAGTSPSMAARFVGLGGHAGHSHALPPSLPTVPSVSGLAFSAPSHTRSISRGGSSSGALVAAAFAAGPGAASSGAGATPADSKSSSPVAAVAPAKSELTATELYNKLLEEQGDTTIEPDPPSTLDEQTPRSSAIEAAS